MVVTIFSFLDCRYDDFDARYLPNGDIVFLWTRKGTALQLVIGKVKRVYAWSNTPAGKYRPSGPRAKGKVPVPAALYWDLWLGTAPVGNANAGQDPHV